MTSVEVIPNPKWEFNVTNLSFVATKKNETIHCKQVLYVLSVFTDLVLTDA